MKKTNQITRFMGTEIDRKDFLKYSGGVLLAIIGVTSLLSALSNSNTSSAKHGYSDSPYGQ